MGRSARRGSGSPDREATHARLVLHHGNTPEGAVRSDTHRRIGLQRGARFYGREEEAHTSCAARNNTDTQMSEQANVDRRQYLGEGAACQPVDTAGAFWWCWESARKKRRERKKKKGKKKVSFGGVFFLA